jgi:hypothetical protein
MSLSEVKAHIASKVAKLGTVKDASSAPPSSTDNRIAIAWEYFIADLLASIAAKRKKDAKKAAEDAGLLAKPDPGNTETVYRTDGLCIVAKTKNPARTINRAKLSVNLMKRMSADEAQKLIKDSEDEASAATEYSFID